MRTFKVDSNNDLVVENGQLVILTGIDAVAQSCEQAVKAQYGEMVLNIQGGVPYNVTVWSGQPNLTQFEVYIRKAIMEVPEVTGISSLNISVKDNTVIYDAVINTAYGAVTLNELRISK